MAGEKGTSLKKEKDKQVLCLFFCISLRIFSVLDLLISRVDQTFYLPLPSINDVVDRVSFSHLLSLLGGSVSLVCSPRLGTEACITGESLPALPARFNHAHGREHAYTDKAPHFCKAVNKVNNPRTRRGRQKTNQKTPKNANKPKIHN